MGFFDLRRLARSQGMPCYKHWKRFHFILALRGDGIPAPAQRDECPPLEPLAAPDTAVTLESGPDLLLPHTSAKPAAHPSTTSSRLRARKGPPRD
eukprot:5191930-Amphidinium_carterae.1